MFFQSITGYFYFNILLFMGTGAFDQGEGFLFRIGSQKPASLEYVST
jgi:hypothetical protein